MLDDECWRPIAGFEGLYSVSSLGRVRSEARTVAFPSKWGTLTSISVPERILSPAASGRSGYLSVILKRPKANKTRRVNRLVCEAFNGPPPNQEAHARHRDGNLTNNAASNLSWGSAKENCEDKKVHGTLAIGSRQGTAKLTESDIPKIRTLLNAGVPKTHIADMYGVSGTCVYYIALGKTWAHVS